jgi:hypothetical protein
MNDLTALTLQTDCTGSWLAVTFPVVIRLAVDPRGLHWVGALSRPLFSVEGERYEDQMVIICRNWYSIPRTLPDEAAHRASLTGMIARRAHSPSSPRLRRAASRLWGLTAQRDRANPVAMLQCVCCDAVRTESSHFIRHRPTGRVLVFSDIVVGVSSTQSCKEQSELALES